MEVWRLALLPDAKTLVSRGKDGTVCFWDTLEGQGTGYAGVWFSPDGNTITWGNQSGALYLWQAPSWKKSPQRKQKRSRRASSQKILN